MKVAAASLALTALFADTINAQTGQGADGNPHGWDRRRRCDGSQYTPVRLEQLEEQLC